MQSGASLEDMTASLAQQARSYLAGEMSADTLAFEDVTVDPASAMLSEHTVILRLGGPCGLLTAFSFSQELGDHLLHQATGHKEFPAERRMLYRRSVLAQAASMIVGHWLADMGEPDTAISLTPTVVLNGAQDADLPENAIFASRSLMTNAGNVDIHLMGSQSMLREFFQPARTLQ